MEGLWSQVRYQLSPLAKGFLGIRFLLLKSFFVLLLLLIRFFIATTWTRLKGGP